LAKSSALAGMIRRFAFADLDTQAVAQCRQLGDDRLAFGQQRVLGDLAVGNGAARMIAS
jgi:hypothetical protein